MWTDDVDTNWSGNEMVSVQGLKVETCTDS